MFHGERKTHTLMVYSHWTELRPRQGLGNDGLYESFTLHLNQETGLGPIVPMVLAPVRVPVSVQVPLSVNTP